MASRWSSDLAPAGIRLELSPRTALTSWSSRYYFRGRRVQLVVNATATPLGAIASLRWPRPDLLGAAGSACHRCSDVGLDRRGDLGAAAAGRPEVIEQQRGREDRPRSGRPCAWPAMSGAEPWTGSNMLRSRAIGVDVAAGGQADAAGDGGGEVGEDVAEQVVGDDDVEACRIRHQEDRGGVDVLVVDRDVGELGRDRVERAGPEVRRRGRARWSCGPASASCAAGPGRGRRRRGRRARRRTRVEALLGRDLVRRADADRAAGADVGTLGALADDDEVDLAGLRRAGSGTPGHSLRRAQVDVVVELEPQLEQQAALQDARRARSGRRRRRAGSRRGRGSRPAPSSGRTSPVRVPARRAEVVLGACRRRRRARRRRGRAP